jgi:hypothetical protein
MLQRTPTQQILHFVPSSPWQAEEHRLPNHVRTFLISTWQETAYVLGIKYVFHLSAHPLLEMVQILLPEDVRMSL